MTDPHEQQYNDERIVVVPVGCCNQTCMRLIVMGLSATAARIVCNLEAETGLNLVSAFQALRERTVEATTSFEALGASLDRLPAKLEEPLDDKVDKKGRKQSQTPFYENVPRRHR